MNDTLQPLDLIKTFISKLTAKEWDENTLYFTPSERIDLTILDNGNAQFIKYNKIAGDWNIMHTIEVETPSRRFWIRIVEVVKTVSGMKFTLPDPLVAGGIAVHIPHAEFMVQEKPHEKFVAPKAKKKNQLPDFTPIKSVGKTKKRVFEDDGDLMDTLAEMGSDNANTN